MTTPYETTKDALLDAALMHVPFDGWSETTFKAAATDA
ncbi:MAG: COQ9 family protein, partial [Pseudomonadota bacterium]